MGKSIDLTGKRFGRLIVIRQIGVDKRRREKTWLCQCDCGNTKETKTRVLSRRSNRRSITIWKGLPLFR